MEKRGVRDVEHVLERRMELRLNFGTEANQCISGLRDVWERERRAARLSFRIHVDPDEPLLLDTGKRRYRASLVCSRFGECRNPPALAPCVVLPAVVGALDLPLDDAAFRERQVTVGAAIEENPRLSIAGAKNHERRAGDSAGDRPPADVTALAGDVPVVAR